MPGINKTPWLDTFNNTKIAIDTVAKRGQCLLVCIAVMGVNRGLQAGKLHHNRPFLDTAAVNFMGQAANQSSPTACCDSCYGERCIGGKCRRIVNDLVRNHPVSLLHYLRLLFPASGSLAGHRILCELPETGPAPKRQIS